MTSKELQQNLSRYGSDLSRWPAKLRQQLEDALGSDASLQEILSREVQFEHRLRAIPLQAPSPGLAQRIILQAKQPSALNTKAVWFWPKTALAMSLLFALGFGLGFGVYQRSDRTSVKSEINLNDFLYESSGVSP